MTEGDLGFSDGVTDRPYAFTQYPVLDQNGKPDTMFPGHLEYLADGDLGVLNDKGEKNLTIVHLPE